jgi:hypothetical protein
MSRAGYGLIHRGYGVSILSGSVTLRFLRLAIMAQTRC